MLQTGAILLAALKGLIQKNNTKTCISTSLPARFPARVKEIIQDQALLLIKGEQTLVAKLDVPVRKGEYLWLQFWEQRNGRLYYRVLSRSAAPSSASSKEPFIFYHAGYFASPNQLLPFYLKRLYDGDKKACKNKDFYHGAPVYEIAIRTENMGIILIHISLHASKTFSFLFYVERREYSNLFAEKKDTFLSYLQNKNLVVKSFQIDVIAANYVAEVQKQFSRLVFVDQKV